jgi:hypothetical protein
MSALDWGASNTTRYYTYTGPAVTNNIFTYTCWIRNARDMGAAYEATWLVGNGNTANGGFTVQLGDFGFQLHRIQLWGKTQNASGIQWAEYGSDISDVDGKDWFLAYTCDNSLHRLYVVEKGTIAPTGINGGSMQGGTGYAAGTWQYGVIGYNSDSYSQRPMGEFAYYNVTLTQDQITALASGIPANTVATPIIWHRFRNGDQATEPNLGSGGATYDATRAGTGWATVSDFWIDGIYRPLSDITDTGWTNSTGSNSWDLINEITYSDADYITSPALGTGSGIIMGLGATLPAGTYRIRVRAKYSTTSGQVKVYLINDSNASQGDSGWQALSASETSYTLPITTSGNATRVKIDVQA